MSATLIVGAYVLCGLVAVEGARRTGLFRSRDEFDAGVGVVAVLIFWPFVALFVVLHLIGKAVQS